MSMDLDPVPGLPLITELFCNSTTKKKKVVISCSFPDELYLKKDFYGGIPAIGLGFLEILLIAIFIILSFKMKSDITKYFLTAVYLPLGISSTLKLFCGIYGFLMGAYGTIFMAMQMFFDMTYTTAMLTISTGSIFYLSGLIIIARRRYNFEKGALWITFFTCLFASILLSSSYHFVAQKWNQLPASSLFFLYTLSTIAIIALLITALLSIFLCTKPKKEQLVSDENPVIYDSRSRLIFGAIYVLIINIPPWFELFVKQLELFTQYLWEDDDEKLVYYSAQRITLLTCDIIRFFLSLLVLLALFINRSAHSAITSWIYHFKKPKQQKKIFVATQQAQPLLLEKSETEKPTETRTEKSIESNAVAPAHTISPPPLMHPSPPGYSGMSFAPGVLQFPQNMQTTIVYTPPVAHQNSEHVAKVEEIK